ncbi:hypothetical protein [Streptomyces sp. NPDC059916]|uniref:hypothetical protein n=1 Tax=Streptomyces sp. NPDC059916 TaxID=3347001 RepID=UPI003698AC46
MSDDADLRALALVYRLARLLRELDQAPSGSPAATVSIGTAIGIECESKLSERAMQRLTDLLEAAESRPRPGVRPPLYVVPTLGEAS